MSQPDFDTNPQPKPQLKLQTEEGGSPSSMAAARTVERSSAPASRPSSLPALDFTKPLHLLWKSSHPYQSHPRPDPPHSPAEPLSPPPPYPDPVSSASRASASAAVPCSLPRPDTTAPSSPPADPDPPSARSGGVILPALRRWHAKLRAVWGGFGQKLGRKEGSGDRARDQVDW
ncbi:uncharacterized protein THITE_2096777 [Thermothielavioides terrestris NRRL 8126]|uniref:Uncharacterized protein n=1 Tax=Thermothielavioides terrestris (strain ATCC 38088 / NRRL 8126) TaxID=578455 RepID=G2R989_THETT|nr:uncharacterized protein THITE_2096777 [Thermothielavioides terrestris NRRL 8126]AEO69487.1 hypothetical protein THITE_2096777 [Thermothielavioides terrestris NRRL 8126]